MMVKIYKKENLHFHGKTNRKSYFSDIIIKLVSLQSTKVLGSVDQNEVLFQS